MELEQPLHALFDIRLYYYIFKMLISCDGEYNLGLIVRVMFYLEILPKLDEPPPQLKLLKHFIQLFWTTVVNVNIIFSL